MLGSVAPEQRVLAYGSPWASLAEPDNTQRARPRPQVLIPLLWDGPESLHF